MPIPEGGKVKQDSFAALQECEKVAESLRAKIIEQSKYITQLEESIENTNKFIVGGS